MNDDNADHMIKRFQNFAKMMKVDLDFELQRSLTSLPLTTPRRRVPMRLPVVRQRCVVDVPYDSVKLKFRRSPVPPVGEMWTERMWRHGNSTASTTVQPYHQSDYVTFTSNSDLSHRAGSNGHVEDLPHRNSLPDPVSDHVLHERRRANQCRANSLQTQALRTGRHEKVSKLNSIEPSYSPTDRAEKDSLTLNERVQIPDKPAFKQNYFKPLGSRGNNYSVSSVSNNPAVLHQRTSNQTNGRESEENIVAMGTLVGSNNTGTSPGLKSSRSSSGSGGQPHINVQSTTNHTQHLSQSSSTGVNLNVRKFNCRYNQTSQSPYASGQTNAKHKEDEPRYPDPSLGAPPAFQQRLSELSSLEADTIRQERAKKLKKRSKES